MDRWRALFVLVGHFKPPTILHRLLAVRSGKTLKSLRREAVNRDKALWRKCFHKPLQISDAGMARRIMNFEGYSMGHAPG